jgi:hypothetical protein
MFESGASLKLWLDVREKGKLTMLAEFVQCRRKSKAKRSERVSDEVA